MLSIRSTVFITSVLVQNAFSGDTPFHQASPSEASWLSYSENYDERRLGTQVTLDDPGALTTESASVSFDHDAKYGASDQRGLLSEGAAEEPGLARRGEGRRPLLSVRGPHFFFCVILFLGFFAAGLKRLSALKPEPFKDGVLFAGRQEEQGERLEEPSDKRPKDPGTSANDYAGARARVQQIREVLPAARRLASAVNTEESAKMLTTMQGAMEDADAATVAEDNQTLERSLTRAEGALRRLRQASIEQAKQVVQAAKSLPALPAFGLWGEGAFDFLHNLGLRTDTQTVELLSETYLSLRGHARRLNERLDEGEREVLSKLRFDNEADGDALLTIAAAVESLRATSESMTRVVTIAGDLGKDLVFGIKCVVMGSHNEVIRDIERQLDSLECCAAAAMAENRRERDEDSAGPESPALQEPTADAGELQRGVSQVASLLNELQALRESVHEGTTLAAVHAADTKALDLQCKAYLMIERCWRLAESFPRPPSSLDENERRLVTEKGQTALHSLVLGKAFIKDVLKKVEETLGEVSEGVEKKVTPFSETLIGAHLHMVSKIMSQEEARVDEAEASADYLEKTAFESLAMIELHKIGTSLRSQERNKTSAQCLWLLSRFVSFLKEDIICMESEMARAVSQSSHLSDVDWSKQKKLLEGFTAAKRAAQEAATLSKAAKAAAKMREYAFEMQNLLRPPNER